MFATSRASLSAVVRASTTQKTQKIQTTTTTATARDDANVDETRRGRRMALLSASVTLGAMTLGADAARAVKGPGEELLAKRLEEEAKSRERIDALYRELRAEEAKALELRREKEGEAQEELNKFRAAVKKGWTEFATTPEAKALLKSHVDFLVDLGAMQ